MLFPTSANYSFPAAMMELEPQRASVVVPVCLQSVAAPLLNQNQSGKAAEQNNEFGYGVHVFGNGTEPSSTHCCTVGAPVAGS